MQAHAHYHYIAFAHTNLGEVLCCLHTGVVYYVAGTTHKVYRRVLFHCTSEDGVPFPQVDRCIVNRGSNTVSPRNFIFPKHFVHLFKNRSCSCSISA